MLFYLDTQMTNFVEYFDSEFGDWRIEATEIGVSSLKFVDKNWIRGDENPSKITKQASSELDQYFRKTLSQFNVALDIQGGTEFQRQIWTKLSDIKYGTTTSYQRLADEIGNPKSVRAVGAANGSNPIAIILPCHRVVGSDGSLTGYAYGVELKRQLLLHEEAISKNLFD